LNFSARQIPQALYFLQKRLLSDILQLPAYVQGSLSPLFYRRFLSPLFIAAFFSGSDSVMRSGSNFSLIVGTELVFFLNY